MRALPRIAGLLIAVCIAGGGCAEGEAEPPGQALLLDPAVAAGGTAPHSERGGIGLLPPRGAQDESLLGRPARIVVDPRVSLAVTDVEILSHFSFKELLAQLVQQSGAPITPLELFHQWWDTQNPAPGLSQGPHCSDALTNGASSLNGFPYECPRGEGAEASNDPFLPLDPQGTQYSPIGLFNRFDLAPADGQNCGEYRIVFARRKANHAQFPRNLVIFEAVLPNPQPTLGLVGCLPVAEFWYRLKFVSSAAVRAQQLHDFYFQGLPGFAPVVHIDHYGAGPSGAGQIRSNQFIQASWMLREFRLAHTCVSGACSLKVVPVALEVNPFGELFRPDSTQPLAAAFRAAFLGALPGLIVPDINLFHYEPPMSFATGQSDEQTDENRYHVRFGQADSPFRRDIQLRLSQLGSSLTPDHVVARAEALSCAGCHQGSVGSDLGGGITMPSSLVFTHVSELSQDNGPSGPRFTISAALTEVFLPHRKLVLERFLSEHQPCAPMVPNCCGDLVCQDVADACPIYCPRTELAE